jgi:hypothetical protein
MRWDPCTVHNTASRHGDRGPDWLEDSRQPGAGLGGATLTTVT